MKGKRRTLDRDPHNAEERFTRYFSNLKKEGIPGSTSDEEELIYAFVEDMRNGFNVKGKGRRGHHRLNNIIVRLRTFYHLKSQIYPNVRFTDLTAEQAVKLFNAARDGELIGIRGKPLRDISSIVNVTSAFHGWISRKRALEGKATVDIFQFVDRQNDHKPAWTYLSFEEVRQLVEDMKFEYRVLFMFLLDSGVRSPTELFNVRVSDLEYDNRSNCYILTVRDETSKTFGRRIKLLLCSSLLKRYLERAEPGTLLFDVSYKTIHKYLRRHAIRTFCKVYSADEVSEEDLESGKITDKYGLLFEDKTTKARGKISELSLYDFRHISVCYWRPRYDGKRDSLLYRLGWRDDSMLDYYEEFLGMKDQIKDEDLLVDVSVSQLEKEFERERRERQETEDELKRRLSLYEQELKEIRAALQEDRKARAYDSLS